MLLRRSIENAGNLLHCALIPVVYAEKPWIDSDDDVWQRIKIAVTPL